MGTLSYAELSELRNFAHSTINNRVPVLAVWRERGESFFQEQQEVRLAEMYANRGW